MLTIELQLLLSARIGSGTAQKLQSRISSDNLSSPMITFLTKQLVLKGYLKYIVSDEVLVLDITTAGEEFTGFYFPKEEQQLKIAS